MWPLTACCWRRNKHNHSTDFTPYEKGMILSPCISPNHLSNSFFYSPSPPSSRYHCHPLSYLYYYISLSSSPFSFSVAGLAWGGRVVSVETEADCQGGKQHASEIKANSETKICCLANVCTCRLRKKKSIPSANKTCGSDTLL